jgi:hypothetical protein
VASCDAGNSERLPGPGIILPTKGKDVTMQQMPFESCSVAGLAWRWGTSESYVMRLIALGVLPTLRWSKSLRIGWDDAMQFAMERGLPLVPVDGGLVVPLTVASRDRSAA